LARPCLAVSNSGRPIKANSWLGPTQNGRANSPLAVSISTVSPRSQLSRASDSKPESGSGSGSGSGSRSRSSGRLLRGPHLHLHFMSQLGRMGAKGLTCGGAQLEGGEQMSARPRASQPACVLNSAGHPTEASAND